MVAKFLDDNKPKTLLNSHCFKVHRFYSISFNLSNIGDIISGVEFQRTGSKFTKKKENLYVVFTCSTKWAREIRKFHVAVGRDRSMVIIKFRLTTLQ